jgi:hypothetical protein
VRALQIVVTIRANALPRVDVLIVAVLLLAAVMALPLLHNQHPTWLGLGSVRDIGLAEARQQAAECRRLLALGKDPIACWLKPCKRRQLRNGG